MRRLLIHVYDCDGASLYIEYLCLLCGVECNADPHRLNARPTSNGSSSFTFPKGQQPLLPPQTTQHKSPKNNGNLQSAVEDIRRQRGKTSCHKELTDQSPSSQSRKQSSFEAVTVLGVLRSEGATTSDLQLLLEDGKVLSNDSQLWEPFDSGLAAASIKVSIQVENNVIKVIKKSQTLKCKYLVT
ncbi:uncharacterized protein V6R79_008155 [Siganus canaliculatus]